MDSGIESAGDTLAATAGDTPAATAGDTLAATAGEMPAVMAGDTPVITAETLSMMLAAYDNIPAGIGIFDLAGDTVRMRYVNDGFYRMIGAHREERERFFDTGTIESVHPDDRPGLLAEAKAALRENRMFDYRFRNLDGKGSYIWIGITATHEALEGGSERFYAAYHNVDALVTASMEEHERYKRSLSDVTAERRKNEILQIITGRSFDLAAVIHLDSRKFEAVYLGEALPDLYRELVPEEGSVCDFDMLCARTATHLDAETRASYESGLSSKHIRDELERNGGSFEFTLEEHFDEKGTDPVYRRFLHYGLHDDPDSVLVIESDVTKEILRQHRLLDQMRTESERGRAIMDSITSGIAELRLSDDGKLSVDSFNQQMFRLLGYDMPGIPQRVEEAKGTPLEVAFDDALTYIHQDDRDRVLGTFIEHRGDLEFSLEPYRMQCADRSYCWISEDVRAHERIPGFHTYYATYRDVTWELEMREELKRRLEEEQALRVKADAANEAKSDFLSRMSHDMRTPLNGVIGMAYLAREQDNPPRTADCLMKIDTSARFLLGLINDVLDMAKMESGKIELHPEPYHIDELNGYLDAVIEPLCREKELRFVLDEDIISDLCPLVDKSCVNQVLFNLLSNAVKFTPAGGMVRYSICEKRLSENRIAVEHRIEDTGIGMSAKFRDRLFEPFTQENRDDSSEERGSGLGLAIVKRLVDLMGGTITVESELKAGSVFTVSLESDAIPAKDGCASQESGDQGTEESADISGMRVLLCEDHPLNQEIAKALLEEKGAAVDVACDGRIGLEMFEVSEPGYYDTILMDVRMPEMDGYETARAIRMLEKADAASVPIIAMTADAFEDDVRRCLDAGMDGHIAKPVEPRHLYAILSRYAHPAQRS